MRIYEELTDKALVETVLSQKEAFSEVIFRYEPFLKRYIKRLGVYDSRDIEDILQNSFIKIYRYLRSYDDSFSFSSWVYRIVHNETYDFFRSKKRRPEIILGAGEEDLILNIDAEVENPAEAFDKKTTALDITEALNKIDKKYMDALLLRYVEDRNYTEISDILQIPEGSVATLLHRGKKELKKIIDKKYGTTK